MEYASWVCDGFTFPFSTVGLCFRACRARGRGLEGCGFGCEVPAIEPESYDEMSLLGVVGTAKTQKYDVFRMNFSHVGDTTGE